MPDPPSQGAILLADGAGNLGALAAKRPLAVAGLPLLSDHLVALGGVLALAPGPGHVVRGVVLGRVAARQHFLWRPLWHLVQALVQPLKPVFNVVDLLVDNSKTLTARLNLPIQAVPHLLTSAAEALMERAQILRRAQRWVQVAVKLGRERRDGSPSVGAPLQSG